jgi:poly(A) polymerase
MTDSVGDNIDGSGGKYADRDDALAVVKRLRDAGHVAYFAGGCVRDMLLGLTPKDFDVATDATPDRVRKLFSSTQAVGAAFGVILVRHRKSQIEVATFRSDVNYVDGRRPEKVVFTTAEEDAKRRDFTINGLFYDPIEEKVIDYVGGQEDLKTGMLRAIGEPNHRFEEDHLRLLRAIRFAARFGLTLEPATAGAIRRHAEHLKRISPERIAEELRLMLTPPTRNRAWVLLWDFKLLDIMFRFFPERGGRPLDADRSIFLALLPDRPITVGLSLAAGALCFRWRQNEHGYGVRFYLSRDEIGRTVKALRQALRISNDEGDEVVGTLWGIRPLLGDNKPTVAVKKRFLAMPTSPQSMDLLNALAAIGEQRERICALYDELTALLDTDFAPPPLITGDDLTAAGLQPGPVFKRVLDAVYDAQLEDRVRSRDEALGMALDLARRESGDARGKPRG